MRWRKPKPLDDLLLYAKRVTARHGLNLKSTLKQARVLQDARDAGALQELIALGTSLEGVRQSPGWASVLQVKERLQAQAIEQAIRRPDGSDDPRQDRARVIAAAKWWAYEELLLDIHHTIARSYEARKRLAARRQSQTERAATTDF